MQESNDFDWLTGIKQEDAGVLRNLSELGERLKDLKAKKEAAEAEAERAKKEYEHYAHVVIPTQMFAAGVDAVSLTSGGSIRIKHQFYCQPNKNAADRKIIADFLRQNGGDYIIESSASVDTQDVGLLKESGIPFTENTTVNTARLKAFLKDKIGATSGVQQFTIEDIPACIHFQEVTTVELEDK